MKEINLIINLDWYKIIPIIISIIALIISIKNDIKINKFNKLKSRPTLFVRSTCEDRIEKKIEIKVDTYKDNDIINIEFSWKGTEGVKLTYKKIYTDKERLWDYILFLELPKDEKEIKGIILAKCTTAFEKKLEYNKKVYIENKYYPLVEENIYELRKIASSEFEL